MRGIGKAAAAALVVVAFGGCLGGGGTGAIRGYRFTITTTMGYGGTTSYQMRGSGAVDLASDALWMEVTTQLPGRGGPPSVPQAPPGFGLGGIGAALGFGGSSSRPPPDSMTQEMVVTPKKVYIRFDEDTQAAYGNQLPPGKQWYEAPGGGSPATFTGMGGPFGPDDEPSTFFETFKDQVRTLRKVGEVDLGGVSTTRYDGRIDAVRMLRPLRKKVSVAEYRDALRQYRRLGPWLSSVWVGADGLVYRMTTEVRSSGGISSTVIDFYDYGDVAVDIPAPGIVVPYTPQPVTSMSFSCTASTSGQSVGTSTVNGVTTTTTC